MATVSLCCCRAMTARSARCSATIWRARRRGLDILRRPAADAATLDAVAAAGYDLALNSCTPAGTAALLKHDGAGWQQAASWPYAAGMPLSHWQHTRHWPALCR